MIRSAASRRHESRPSVQRLVLALALLVSVLVSARAVTREEAFFLQGDPPRYLMDGAFLYDLARSGAWWHPSEVMPFAERYYARYPALSLGHHPPLLAASLVPFYAAFGVSVFSARLAIVAFFVLAVLLLDRVATAFYDEDVGAWSALLFASSPVIGQYSQRVLSEIPAIACAVLAVFFLTRFRCSRRVRHYLLFIAAALTTLIARPTTVYMFPAYLGLLLMDGGIHLLRERRIATITLAGAGLGLVVVVAYLAASPFNSAVVASVLQRGVDMEAVVEVWRALVREPATAAVATVALLLAIAGRDRRVIAPLLWVASVLICTIVMTGMIEPGRYALPFVPGLCILAASLVTYTRTREQYLACGGAFLIIVTMQLTYTWQRPTWDAPGYETAARFVATQTSAPTVLYSASIDTGYFAFYIRKHDPAQRLVVLRADKLLTTSQMAQLNVENRIQTPDEIYELLQRYGTRFVVIEDRPSGDMVLDWLREIVRTNRFVERQRYPIGKGGPGLDGVSLAIYEYLDATPPAADAQLDLNIPLVGRRIRVPLASLAPLPATR